MNFKYMMLRTTNIKGSIEFFTNIIGLEITDQDSYENYDLVFLGIGSTPFIQIVYNHGINLYEVGTLYGHIVIQVCKCEYYGIIERCESASINHRLVSHGTNRKLIFIEGPDKIEIEIYYKERT